MAGGSATLYLSGLDRSYRPPTGLAAARMLVRAFSVAYAQGDSSVSISSHVQSTIPLHMKRANFIEHVL